jgi:hypothetical protein
MTHVMSQVRCLNATVALCAVELVNIRLSFLRRLARLGGDTGV